MRTNPSLNMKNMKKNINQPVIKQTFVNQNIVLGDTLAKELITNLPKSRQNNVTNIITQAEENIQSENENIKCPEPEWFGPFLDNCKDVRSEDLQKIWSKVFTWKKLMEKNDTSIRTMSVLSKINSSEANLFNRFLKYKIGRFIYYKENKMPIGFPTFDEISLLLENRFSKNK